MHLRVKSVNVYSIFRCVACLRLELQECSSTKVYNKNEIAILYMSFKIVLLSNGTKCEL